jgi:hypothetical protein
VEVTFESAVLRTLRTLDPSLTMNWLRDAMGIHDEEDIVRARNATMRERPADVRKFFQAQLRPIVGSAAAVPRAPGTPVRSGPANDPYGF